MKVLSGNYNEATTGNPTLFYLAKALSADSSCVGGKQKTDNASAIGVSFPEYNADKFLSVQTATVCMRRRKILEQMHCEKWLNRLSDYVHVSRIKPVPGKISGACLLQAY